MKSKITLITLFLGCALTLGAQDYTPKYKLINNPDYLTNDLAVATYDATDYGVDNTGTTDCTATLQTLLDKLAGVGTKSDERGNYENITGGILYLPAGTYLCSGKLVIPRGVTLRGDWKKPVKGQTISGTIIKVTQGKGETNISNAFITMQPTTEISNLTFWYPEQTGSTVYSPTILMGQEGYWGNDYCNVRHVTLVNSWIGIQFNYNNGGGCPNIFEVYGTPLSKGIEMDELADVGRFDWIDFAAHYWAGSGLTGAPAESTIASLLKSQATGFVMRRNDWSYLCNYSCDGYQVGYLATKSVLTTTTPNGQCCNMTLSNCGIGMQIQATSYAGYMYTRVSTPGCEVGVQVEGGTVGPSEFYECQLTGSEYAVHTTSNNSAAVMLQDCKVTGATLVEGGQFSADNSTFSEHVTISPLARTIFTGNSFSSGSLVNNSIFECIVSDKKNGGKSLPAFGEDDMTIKTTRPTREQLYVVEGLTPLAITDDLNSAADSKETIQEVLNKAGGEGGGIVYIPAGHYRINGNLVIPKNVELKGASDLGSVPKGNGTILECFVNHGFDESDGKDPFIQMKEGSGLRGITINYPNQKDPADVKKYPYTIRGNKNCYIVNVSMRAAYRGVDLFTNDCSGHYVDYLAGHAFMNVIRVGGGSKNGTISNIQFNTIAYAFGYETKFGAWPNSLVANKSASYGQNEEDLDFMIIGNCDGEVLYNNFLFGCKQGMIFQKDSGTGASNLHSMGNAVDGAVNTFVFNGASGDIDLINSQVVALNHDNTEHIIKGATDAHFVSTGTGFDKTVNFFASCHWGAGKYFADVKGGTVNFLLFNSNQAGTASTFTTADNTNVKIHNGCVNGITKLANTSGTDEPRMTITSSYCTPTGANTESMKLWQNDLPMAWKVVNKSQLADRTGWVATSDRNNNDAKQAIDGNDDTRWHTSGAQTAGWWFNVNFNKEETFNTLIFDASGSPNDGPKGYKIEAYIDGAWKEVATGTNAGALLIVTFSEVTATQVRATLTETKTGGYWSIYEFNIGNLDITNTDEPAFDIPGTTIQAEDFNGEHDFKQADTKGDYDYRSDAKIATGTNATGDRWIGDTQPGDYFEYVMNVTQRGCYKIDVYSGCGNANGGAFKLSFDGGADESYTTGKTSWTAMSSENDIYVYLSEGKHTMKFTVVSDLNIDCFEFTATTEAPQMKVIGTLNSHDIEEIHKSTAVTKIDLSEAKFEADTDDYSYGSHEEKKDGQTVTVEHHTAANTITQYMFDGMSSLTEVVLPENTTAIEQYVFRGTGLTTLTVPDNVKAISGYAFSEIDGVLTSVKLPGGITEIPYGLFKNTSISEIVIPETVTKINDWGYGTDIDQGHTPNYTTTSVTFEGNSVTSIGYGAFRNLRALESIGLPEGLTSVGAAVLMQCTGLKSVSLPSTLTALSDHMFDGDAILETLMVNAVNAPSTDGKNDVFKDVVPNKCSVKFTSGVNKSSYRANADFMALLTKTMDEDNTAYDVCLQDYADVQMNKRTLKPGWNTMVLPFTLSINQLTDADALGAKAIAAYYVGMMPDGKTLKFITQTGQLEAYKPFIVYVDKTIDEPLFKNVDLKSDAPVVGAYGDTDFMANGTFVKKVGIVPVNSYYILDNKMYLSSNEQTVSSKGFRAWFEKGVGLAAKSSFDFILNGDATEIQAIEGGTLGVVDVYNLNGQLLRRNTRSLEGLKPGVYVVNGKKVIVK